MSETEADKIEELIASDTSPVGIDAKKTHVLIIQKLLSIEQRLKKIEARVETLGSRS
ncbi:MAG: hypothetical protein ACE5GX_13975 [Thermoanaerobaculia bacterium]